MSTDTAPAPTVAPTTSPPDPLAETQRQMEDAIRAANEAKARFDALSSAKPAPAPEPAPQAPPAPTLPPELAEELTAFKAARQREREDAALRYAREQGLSLALPREELVKLVPIIDPNTDEGRAAFEAWRNARPQVFAPRGRTVEQVRAEQTPRIEALKAKKTNLINPDWIVRRHQR